MELVDVSRTEIDCVRDCPVGRLTHESSLPQFSGGGSEAVHCVEFEVGTAPEDRAEFAQLLVDAVRLLVRIDWKLSGEPIVVSLAFSRIAIRSGKKSGLDGNVR